MESRAFDRICPACGGPFVRGEGGAGCVLCGHAIREIPRPRARGRIRTVRARLPRQLLLLPLDAA
jgi:uncharacterized Zn finger protein (UPF0148 family)